MKRQTNSTRRRVLQASGAVALAGLAGCLANAPVSGETASPTGTAESPEDDHQEEDDHGDDDHGDDDHDDEESHETPTESKDDDHSHHDDHHHEDLPDEMHHGGEVRMLSTDDGEHFSPHVTWIEPGSTVTFVNESGSHSATAYHPDNDKPLLAPEAGKGFDTGTLTEAGASAEVTLETTGVYHYYCIPHESLGMIGTVVVGEPDPHEQPAMEDVEGKLSGTPATKVAELNEMVDRMLGHGH